jgi:hypothetical protein
MWFQKIIQGGPFYGMCSKWLSSTDIQLLAEWTFYLFFVSSLVCIGIGCSWEDTLENVDFIEI